MYEIDKTLLTALVAPLSVALASWFIKDYIFGVLAKRQEALKNEWRDRLKNFWSPLFFWSGLIVALGGKKEDVSEATTEVQKLLAGNAHLLPRNHYYTLVKLLESASVLPERKLELKELQATREFIFKQIEILNFLLYKRDTAFDPAANTSLLSGQQYLLRLVSQVTVQIITWGLLAGYIYLVYYFVIQGNYFFLALLISPFVLAVVVDIKKRIKLHQETQ